MAGSTDEGYSAAPPEAADPTPITTPIQLARPTSPATVTRKVPLALLAVALLAVLAAIISYRHGVAVNLFPPFLADGGPTPIKRYSAPWLVGAAALLTAAGLLAVAGFSQLQRSLLTGQSTAER